ncbi:MAG: DUF2079 domain-containing protein [Candidatus Sumerlaeota bacterium]
MTGIADHQQARLDVDPARKGNLAARVAQAIRQNAKIILPTALLVAAAAGWMLYVTWTQYASNHTYLADVGIFDAICYGPLYGNWLRTPLAPDASGNYFGIHFQPYLLLITPLYLLANETMTLLSVLTLSVVVAVIPWALLVFAITKDRLIMFAAALLFLGNHFILSMHLANHPESLALPWIFALFFAQRIRHRSLFIVSLLLALTVKEDFAIFLGIWSASLLIDKTTRRDGAIALSICVAWWIIAQMIMHACGAAEFERLGMTPTSRFASMGTTKPQIITYAMTHPTVIVARVFAKPLWLLILSTGLICIFDWKTFAVGVIGASIFLITDDPIISRLDYYYSYGALPFFFLATANAIPRVLSWKRGAHGPLRIAISILFACASVAGFLSPTRTDDLKHRPFPITPHQRAADLVMKQIPKDAAVAAQFDLYPRVPHRKDLFGLREVNLDRAQYVAMDLTGRAPDLNGDERERVFKRLRSAEWSIVLDIDDYVILKKNSAAP